MLPTPISRYQRLIEECQISPDTGQEAVIEKLQALYEQLTVANMLSAKDLGLWERLKGRLGTIVPASPKGIYLWGGVGRGKSMLMDVFYQSLPMQSKRRVHFHAFMQEMHATIHRHRQAGVEDTLIRAAQEVASAYRILCFDELQIQDITDAMMVSRLFGELFASGVVVVFTSNRPPEDLYLHGLQRDRFLPFIALIRAAMQVVEITSSRDYRLGRLQAAHIRYLVPDTEDTRQQLARHFHDFICHTLPETVQVPVHGRMFVVEKACREVAWCSFASLCDAAVGAPDYLALTTMFRVFFIPGIPVLTPEDRNQAKRFVTLVDVLYEAKALLFCTAAATPEQLYPAGDGHFEFARTASRLREMMAEDYGMQAPDNT
jgi:cell division protein ZapE